MSAQGDGHEFDVVLIDGGIMSATVGTLLKELDPSLAIALYERLEDCGLESSHGWNNAGTGHAANCEMNDTPQKPDGTVDISKALVQTPHHKFETLQAFFPDADARDWKEAAAGQRVQIIKPDGDGGGTLQFGTELVGAGDHSSVALLGASPGASTAAFIAVSLLEKCFRDKPTEAAWLPKLREIIPTYGIDLKTDAEACRRTRADTAPVLGLRNI